MKMGAVSLFLIVALAAIVVTSISFSVSYISTGTIPQFQIDSPSGQFADAGTVTCVCPRKIGIFAYGLNLAEEVVLQGCSGEAFSCGTCIVATNILTNQQDAGLVNPKIVACDTVFGPYCGNGVVETPEECEITPDCWDLPPTDGGYICENCRCNSKYEDG